MTSKSEQDSAPSNRPGLGPLTVSQEQLIVSDGAKQSAEYKQMTFAQVVERYGDASQNAVNPNFVKDLLEFENERRLEITESALKTASANMTKRYHESKRASKKLVTDMEAYKEKKKQAKARESNTAVECKGQDSEEATAAFSDRKSVLSVAVEMKRSRQLAGLPEEQDSEEGTAVFSDRKSVFSGTFEMKRSRQLAGLPEEQDSEEGTAAFSDRKSVFSGAIEMKRNRQLADLGEGKDSEEGIAAFSDRKSVFSGAIEMKRSRQLADLGEGKDSEEGTAAFSDRKSVFIGAIEMKRNCQLADLGEGKDSEEGTVAFSDK